MASSNTDQSGSHAVVANAPSPPTTMHPELLMAACHGYYGQLTHLLDREGAAVTSVASQVVVEIQHSTSSAASLLLQGVTPDGDSALHIVATFGDGDQKYLKSAEVIYDKAKHLLGACNKGNNTPLHCAARAGNVAMLSLLINLARGEEGGDGRVETLVRMQNKLGETALHEAIRGAHMPVVDVLMTADPCLARVPDRGTSPLFLALSLCHNIIARELYMRDNLLSYSGPDGQNALHAAVHRSKEMTELLLGWNNQLTKQQDQHGNTPLHFAVSLESDKHGMLPLYAVPVEKGKSITTFLNIREPPLELTKQILEADAYSAYQPNKQGSFPIHVAASAGRLSAVIIFVTRYSGCAGLRDTDGRTFLHVAVKNKRYNIVAYACQTPALSSILNKQDNEGNTALHQAVVVGDWWIFASLFVNKQVDLNLPNNMQHTPLGLSINTIPTGLYCLLHSQILIQETLMSANATRDICQREYSTQSAAENDDKVISDSTQFLGIALVLIITMAFGATFALPGGYRADDHDDGGTPTLARLKEFQGFMMANTLAFVCSSIAVLSLVFAGTPTVELPMRYRHYNISIWLSFNAIGSLCIAFVIAVYVMITPVAARTSIAVIVVIASVAILHSPSILEKFYKFLIVLFIRLGILPILRSDISKTLLLLCWPIIVIFGWQEYASRHQ